MDDRSCIAPVAIRFLFQLLIVPGLNDRKTSPPRWAWFAGCVAICLGAVHAAAAPGAADQAESFFAGAKDAVICKDTLAPRGRCIVGDGSKPAGTIISAQTEALTPGSYLLHLPMALGVTNHINTAALEWQLTVGGSGKGGRTFDMLMIERAKVYQTIDCPFVVERAGSATVTLSWRRVSLDGKGTGVRTRVTAAEMPTVGGSMEATVKPRKDRDASLAEMELEGEPDIGTLKTLTMAAAPFRIEKLSNIAITRLEVDKVRYRPGERPAISLEVRNLSDKPRKFTCDLSLLRELDETTALPPVLTETVAPGQAATLSCQGPALSERWGYEVRAVVKDEGGASATASEYFTVHDNMWAVAITGRAPAQFTAHVTRENAIASAKDSHRLYRNWVESGFWAPDEFGDFTPDTENWWGGQGCYYGGVNGTKMMIEEGHKRGISYAVYSNIWGGDGPPAFETVRRDPEWGYPSTFNTEWFERWDRNTMGTGKPGPGMHVWPITIITGKEEPFRHHGRELIATHKMFGWDAVRYDSHSIDDGTARMVELGREVVWKELPDFQYGYNSSVPGGDPAKLNAFKAQCRNGGLIMEEGIGSSGENHVSYEDFARKILDFKEEARRYGGNFLAIGMSICPRNDLLYQYIFWLAGNTHPCYDWQSVCVANYMQLATRYSGLIWDLNVTSVAQPQKWIDMGDAADQLWMWPRYVHQRDVGGGRRQLIVHLINKPLETRLNTNDDCRLPAPIEKMRVAVKFPAGAKLKAAWSITGEYSLTQRKLPAVQEGQGVTLTLPRLRFWNMLVIELDSCGSFE